LADEPTGNLDPDLSLELMQIFEKLNQQGMTIIIALALLGGRIDPGNFDWKKLFKRITIAFFVYLILSSTLHPWYVLPLLAFSLFTNYTFPLAWSFVIFFSYVFYQFADNTVWEVRLVSTVEYALVVGLFVWEMMKGGVREPQCLGEIKIKTL